jgi:hypothetical protein
MVLLNDPKSDPLVFSRPGYMLGVGIGLVCLGAAGVAAGVLVPGLSRPLLLALVAGGCAAGLAGGLIAGWMEVLRLDLRGRVFEYRRGIGRYARTVEGPLDWFDRVSLQLTPSTNMYGEEGTSVAVRLEGTPVSVVVAARLGEEETRALAARIAWAMGKSVEERGADPGRGRMRLVLKRCAAWSVWAGMAAVGAMVVWTGTHHKARPFSGPASFNLRANNRQPDFSVAYQNGVTLYARGDFLDAERELRKAVNERPTYADAYNELTYALADQYKLDEALATARKALSLAPNSGDILDTVAEMHQRRKEFKEAADFYEQALKHELTQGACQTHTKYGETLLALGQRKEAEWHWQLAVADTNRMNQQWQMRAAAGLRKVVHGPIKLPSAGGRTGGAGLNEHPFSPSN